MSTGLFADEEDGYNIDETKYKLKLGDESPAPADNSLEDLEDLGGAEEEDAFADLEDLGAEEPADDKPFDDEPFDAGVEADEEEDPKTYIQQLSGKLGQSLRKYTDEEGQPDYDLEKFAINSVVSATHSGDMDDNDQKDIINKVKSAGKGEDDIDVDVNVDTGDSDDELDVDVNDIDNEGGDDAIDLEGGDEMEEGLLEDEVNEIHYGEKAKGLAANIYNRFIEGNPNPPTASQIADAINDEVGKINPYYIIAIVEKHTGVRLAENLSKSGKSRIFTKKSMKDQIIEGLSEMTEPKPLTKPAPTTTPETQPEVKPLRRNKPWRVRPRREETSPKPKAEDVLGETQGYDGQIIDTKFLNSHKAILNVNINGEVIEDLEFENTGSYNDKPLAYDEPWIYNYVADHDGKEYVVGVEFYGHPDYNLELGDIADDYVEEM